MLSTRRYINLAFRYMQMRYSERIDYLKKLFDSKLNKGGHTARPEQYSISNEELKNLANKLGLPEQEVNNLDVQFRHYDFDGSGTLDLEEVRNILADIGLTPQNREEKFEVTECINEMTQKIGCEEFTFEPFLELLKEVRERVRQVQNVKCWKLFHEADVNGEDSLDMTRVMALLETKLGLFLRSAEESTEAFNIFSQCDSEGRGALNLDEFQLFVQKVRAKLLTLRRREEVLIAKKFDLEPELVNEFRSSLPFLWKVFERYSFGRPDQGLRKEDLLPFMVDVGTAPPNTEEMQCLPILDIIKEFARPYTKFPAVLEIVQKARVATRASLEEDLTASFRHYDRDGSGELSMQEIYGILEAREMSL
ncbi:Cetn4 [Symbiodinium pilosum]|uniref:Cetn4 protein n=1 Tax=Symbiodinium pilosum TaxID=2952 RepID=A0A812QHV5_SYMPI|nr:Cetn4 [Symbiodinium pilosum]